MLFRYCITSIVLSIKSSSSQKTSFSYCFLNYMLVRWKILILTCFYTMPNIL